ncbi:MAG TPA: peptide deformylase [Firmicutes bacterium]|jgi:peptide deformylase|nr:peptide deformylase [Bacillota bacterium]
MALRVIRKEGDPVLRKKTVPVSKFTPQLVNLIEDMIETMLDAEGVGLAAPQIGISKSIIVVKDNENIFEIINPEIISGEGEVVGIEGCLSLPGIYGEVPRFSRVEVKGLNRYKKEVNISAEGFISRIFQHEIDHLRGVLFVDRAVKLLTPEEIKKISEKH